MRAKLDRLETFFNHMQGSSRNDGELFRPSFDSLRDEARGSSQSLVRRVDLRVQPSGATLYLSPSHWESIMDDVRWKRLSWTHVACSAS